MAETNTSTPTRDLFSLFAAKAALPLAADLAWANEHYCDEDNTTGDPLNRRIDDIFARVERLPLTAENARLRAQALGIMCGFESDEVGSDTIWDRLVRQLILTHWAH